MKYLPILLGLVCGFFLVNPPAWLQSLGLLGYAIAGVIVFLIMLGVVMMLIIPGSLPANVELTPDPEAGSRSDLQQLSERYRQLGFTDAGPSMRVGMSPPAALIGLVHEEERCYGTVFRTGTTPAKTAFDFVSILDGDRGGLTTSAERGSGALIAAPGEFRQIFPGAGVEELFRRHIEGQAYLRENGVPTRAVNAGTLAGDFKSAIRIQRRTFLSNPIVFGIVAIVRAATGQSPHLGPLSKQRLAKRQLAELTGRSRS
jgi:hypothetical protein